MSSGLWLWRKEFNYLGHVISEKGVFPEQAKTRVIEEYPTPQNVKQLRSFLGLMSYYRRFVPKFSHIAAPLHKLLKKDAPYEWTISQEQAFQTLKGKLLAPPVLKYPDFNERFILTTDASGEGLGAVLSQGEVGKDLPVAFASRTLNQAEKNYSTTEKELLAIVWGMIFQAVLTWAEVHGGNRPQTSNMDYERKGPEVETTSMADKVRGIWVWDNAKERRV